MIDKVIIFLNYILCDNTMFIEIYMWQYKYLANSYNNFYSKDHIYTKNIYFIV